MIHARGRAALSACLAAVLLSACGSSATQRPDKAVTLDFFQFKPEAVATFDKLIADFEAEHPGIDVQQHHVPEPDTAIRARLVKDNIPDVITLNGNSTFGELASAGVFYDFSQEKAADETTSTTPPHAAGRPARTERRCAGPHVPAGSPGTGRSAGRHGRHHRGRRAPAAAHRPVRHLHDPGQNAGLAPYATFCRMYREG